MKERPPHRPPTWADRVGGYLDSAIGVFAPGWASQRKGQRRADRLRQKIADVLNGHWEGAGRDDLRADKWLGSRLSPDDAIDWELSELRLRVDELYRNFGLCNGTIEGRVDNVVGAGIALKARIRETPGKITKAQAEQWNGELDGAFERLEPQIGKSGRVSLTDVQRLVERYWRRDGEAFVVRSAVARPDKPVPLQVDVIDPRRVETPPEFAGDPNVRFGIRTDGRGEILGYYVRSAYPGDSRETRLKYEYFTADRVCHVFEQLWADQTRGVPWFAAVLNEIRDFKDFREAVIIAAQVAACITMIVGTADQEALAAGATNRADEDLQPGRILYRPLADTVHCLTPSQPATTYGMFSEQTHLGLAGGLNWPMGWLTKDRRKASYSAGKLEEIEGGVGIRVDQKKLHEAVDARLWAWFVSECVLLGVVSIPPAAFVRERWLYTRVKPKPPGRPSIDPSREIPALVQAKNENILPLEEIHGRQGLDTDEVFERRAYEREYEEELGIVPPANAPKAPPPGDDEETEEDLDEEEEDVEEEEDAFALAGAGA